MVESCKIDYTKLKEDLSKLMNEHEIEFLSSNDTMRDVTEINTTKVITKDKLDEYIKEAEEKVIVVIKELLGE